MGPQWVRKLIIIAKSVFTVIITSYMHIYMHISIYIIYIIYILAFGVYIFIFLSIYMYILHDYACPLVKGQGSGIPMGRANL